MHAIEPALRLRARFEAVAAQQGFRVVAAPLRYCGDNAAMIGAAAAARFDAGCEPKVEVDASVAIDDPRLHTGRVGGA